MNSLSAEQDDSPPTSVHHIRDNARCVLSGCYLHW